MSAIDEAYVRVRECQLKILEEWLAQRRAEDARQQVVDDIVDLYGDWAR